jgi:hypothetical protein
MMHGICQESLMISAPGTITRPAAHKPVYSRQTEQWPNATAIASWVVRPQVGQVNDGGHPSGSPRCALPGLRDQGQCRLSLLTGATAAGGSVPALRAWLMRDPGEV